MKAIVAGYIETSLNDVIGEVSFVIWFCGCNLRCPYCQNFPMVINDKKLCHTESIDSIINKIKETKGYIGYVQVTGGEPTLQEKQLEYLYRNVKMIGVNTSLDTNGTKPHVIKNLWTKKMLDHVAMDIKAPLEPKRYAAAAGIPMSIASSMVKKIEESLEIISEMEFVEIRTTYVPGVVNEDDIVRIADFLSSYLTKKKHYYVLQQFIPNKNAPDPKYREGGLIDVAQLIELAHKIEDKIPNVAVRHIGGVEYVKEKSYN